MDRLTSFDSSFLVNERANSHMTLGAALICDGSTPPFEDFLAQVRSRLHLLPRFRQKLAVPPLHLGRPFWVDDEEFDLLYHVRQVDLPAPGGEEQFREMIGNAISPALDRGHPLWELWLVDGFADDCFGIIYKTHHALADGISAVDIATLLFDLEPVAEPVRDVVPWEASPTPSPRALAGRGVSGLFSTLARGGRWLMRAARAPVSAWHRAANGAIGLWEVGKRFADPAPKVPFNVPISTDRRFTFTRCRLDDLKRIKNVFGGTVNDVTLAVSAAALRRWLQEEGIGPDSLDMKALVPVSVRTEDEHGELGNKLTAMRGPLPVHEADPVRRLRLATETMDGLKSSKQPLGAAAMWALNDWFREFAPPWLVNFSARINFSTKLFNLLVTNFPGPQFPVYVLGREVVDAIPFGFLAPNHALSIAIFSYNGSIDFGVVADGKAIKGSDRISTYIGEGVEELLAAADAAAPGRNVPEAA